MDQNDVIKQSQELRSNFELTRNELSKIIIGHEELIHHIYISLICGGHVLIEGVPGLGKTLMVKTFAKAMDLEYSRIQFTPDLMPADILGTNIVNEDEKGKRRFEFYRGPIFGQILLADEINRATPKTQSALLEAMQENRVTIFGKTYPLKLPFMVLATQNPLEMEGTYPLPEAQTDRFFFKLKVTYPTADQLVAILDKTTEEAGQAIEKVTGGELILNARRLVKQIPIATHVKNYAVNLVLGTHPGNIKGAESVQQFIRYGASPRGAQALVLAAKTSALLEGMTNVSLDHVRAVAKPALRHRIILNLKGEADGIDPDLIIEDIIKTVPRG